MPQKQDHHTGDIIFSLSRFTSSFPGFNQLRQKKNLLSTCVLLFFFVKHGWQIRLSKIKSKFLNPRAVWIKLCSAGKVVLVTNRSEVVNVHNQNTTYIMLSVHLQIFRMVFHQYHASGPAPNFLVLCCLESISHIGRFELNIFVHLALSSMLFLEVLWYICTLLSGCLSTFCSALQRLIWVCISFCKTHISALDKLSFPRP